MSSEKRFINKQFERLCGENEPYINCNVRIWKLTILEHQQNLIKTS